MLDGFLDLVERHGWHVIVELFLLGVFVVFGLVYFANLARGRARAVVCQSCGRVASRAHGSCPRCGGPL
jgi:hypothetical protein